MLLTLINVMHFGVLSTDLISPAFLCAVKFDMRHAIVCCLLSLMRHAFLFDCCMIVV